MSSNRIVMRRALTAKRIEQKRAQLWTDYEMALIIPKSMTLHYPKGGGKWITTLWECDDQAREFARNPGASVVLCKYFVLDETRGGFIETEPTEIQHEF